MTRTLRAKGSARVLIRGSSKFRRQIAVIAAALVVGVGLAPAAVAGTWSWGYNYMGSSLNPYEHSGYNYWAHGSVNITNSGGSVQFGWAPSGSCYVIDVGAAAWSGKPSDLGCGGYIDTYGEYWAGATSYVQLTANT